MEKNDCSEQFSVCMKFSLDIKTSNSLSSVDSHGPPRILITDMI